MLPGSSEIRPRRALDDALRAQLRARKAMVAPLRTEDDPLPHSARDTDLLPRVSGTWRVVVDHGKPVAGPIRINACTMITDPARCAEITLADLERAVAHRNAGRETAYTQLIDEYVERLAACGLARVEVVQ